jgi:hypothetical protein
VYLSPLSKILFEQYDFVTKLYLQNGLHSNLNDFFAELLKNNGGKILYSCTQSKNKVKKLSIKHSKGINRKQFCFFLIKTEQGNEKSSEHNSMCVDSAQGMVILLSTFNPQNSL